MTGEAYETPVERLIREARERGDFDDLPGAGRPVPGLDERRGDDWWVQQMLRREGLDASAAMPPTLQLRKEADTYPEALRDLRTEESVRAVLDDFNRRVREDRLRPATGSGFPLLARTLDVEALVERWRVLRAQDQADRAREAAVAARPEQARPWWRRLLGRA